MLPWKAKEIQQVLSKGIWIINNYMFIEIKTSLTLVKNNMKSKSYKGLVTREVVNQ